MADKEIARDKFVFGKTARDELILQTKYFDTGAGHVYITQELTLQTECNSVTLKLEGNPFLPDELRKLANQLESGCLSAEYRCKYNKSTVAQTAEIPVK